MAAVATYREINNGGIVTKVYDVDKNGVTMKHGDVVEITGGYFKRDNGLWVIARAPGDEGWCGDYCLHRLNKNGTPSKSKDNVEFWPLTACVSDRRKTLEARAHNAEHAQIEIITPATIAAEPAKEEPKGEAAVEENAPVQPAEQTQKSAKTPRYQVIVNDDRWGGLDEKLDYSRINDARKAMRDYVNKEDWESSAIYDRKKGEIIETFGEYFPMNEINARTKTIVETVEEHRKEQPETKPEAEPAEIFPESAGDVPEEVPETVEPTPEPVKPSPIREDLARRAHDMMSYSDYREGSATAEYNALCERAEALAEAQKHKVDSMYHGKIDALVSSYKRRTADNINRRNEIGTRCPSVLVAGPANFPTKKKLKQNAASDRNMEEYNEIQSILDKIRSTGTGGITTDDPNAREKIEKKIEALQALQNTMKAVNAYHRKHGTLEGCPDITPEQAETIAAGMERDWRSEPKPFEAYQLSNNNAEIHRLRARLADLDKLSANTETGWTFNGGSVEICREDNRVRIFHDSKPDADVISELKSNGFKWARSIGAWQRQLTENAINAARRITSKPPVKKY